MRVLILTVSILFTDQLTKLLVKGFRIPFTDIAVDGMVYGASKPVLGEFFRLTYIENAGMAFGIEFGGKILLSFFSIIACCFIVYYLYKTRKEALGLRISLALILGGALGNLIDRVFYGVLYGEAPLFYGKVVDFLDVDFFNINMFGFHMSRWPVFNVADASVTIGVLLLLVVHRPISSRAKAVSETAAPSVDSPTPSPTENAISDL